ncbi:MAG: succinylglutamate desuccinylase [Rhodothermales bacterium]|nr:succinylglutamate desuccinylase [Rhodothermales bacterium]
MDTFTFTSHSVRPGQKDHGFVEIEIRGIIVKLPVYLINGAEEGPTLVVTAGIHGGEYPCVEAATRLGQSIDPTKLKGRMLIVPSANPIAFKARSIYVTPVDGLNLNRQFPGDPEGTFTRAWAAWLFRNVISRGDLYIDMHGGDMIEALVPFVSFNLTGNEAVDRTARRMAEAYGIRAMLVKRDTGGLAGTTYAAAARDGIPALLTEAGGQGVWNEDEVDILQSGVRRVMTEFEMYEPVDDPGETAVELGGWEWLRSAHEGLFYPSVSVGDHVTEGQFVGRVADIFGETLQEAHAPVSGEVLFLVTSLAINDDDPLMAIAYS